MCLGGHIAHPNAMGVPGGSTGCCPGQAQNLPHCHGRCLGGVERGACEGHRACPNARWHRGHPSPPAVVRTHLLGQIPLQTLGGCQGRVGLPLAVALLCVAHLELVSGQHELGGTGCQSEEAPDSPHTPSMPPGAPSLSHPTPTLPRMPPSPEPSDSFCPLKRGAKLGSASWGSLALGVFSPRVPNEDAHPEGANLQW